MKCIFYCKPVVIYLLYDLDTYYRTTDLKIYYFHNSFLKSSLRKDADPNDEESQQEAGTEVTEWQYPSPHQNGSA